MRKQIIKPTPPANTFDESKWLDLDAVAHVEISSEHPEFPIEGALTPGVPSGWRAAEAGKQTIRIRFDAPQRVQQVYLQFHECSGAQRTQEFSLSALTGAGQPAKEIVRQQFNFNSDTSTEIENYRVNLDHVTALELVIVPDQSGGDTCASLAKMRIA